MYSVKEYRNDMIKKEGIWNTPFLIIYKCIKSKIKSNYLV
jgi:hypothetical protein